MILQELLTLIEGKPPKPGSKQANDFDLMMAGAMSRDAYNKKWKLGKHKPKDNSKNLDGPGGIYKNLVKKIK